MENGGPVIRLRTLRDLAGEPDPAALDLAQHAVLQSEKTRRLLEQMDAFGPLTHVDIRVLNSLHGGKATCLENVIPRLLERGLRAGAAEFDRRMDRFRKYVDNPIVQKALEQPESPTVEGGRAVFIAIVMASYFIRAGYDFAEIDGFVRRRIDCLSHLAASKDYAIHLDETRLAGLPKAWKGKPILRPEVEPMVGCTPLPLIHDLFALAYLRRASLAETTLRQIDAIAGYVNDERCRAFPPGYGYIWPAANRQICYACGWNLDLPDLANPNPCQQRKVVQRLELLARFPTARHSAWFQQGLRLLESFQTERGTYRFPGGYLPELSAGYFVGGEYMGLEDGRRGAKALELESTFRMLYLKQLIAGPM
jgi:hypothetical protein